MEDEECLPENSYLKLYLQSLGLTDFHVTQDITARDFSSYIFEMCKPEGTVETIDEDIIDQISIIISTQMLFEEDVSKVEQLLSNFRVVKNGMLKSLFNNNLFGVATVFLGLCLFWVIGYYAFFIVSSFYAFFAADYLSRKHFNRRRLKTLTTVLKSNFMLLKKAIKFIEENKLLEASISCSNNSVKFMEGFDSYNNFKYDFYIYVNEMISILEKSTQKLIIKIPLCAYMENPKYYLCNTFNKNYESSNMSNLYEIYLLVQSEFLQRLILSLIPNIKLSTKDSCPEINKILTETCVSFLKLKNKLNRKFKFLYLNGIYSLKSGIQFKLPSNHRFSNSYMYEFILNIHETSKTLQRLLLQCRILEEKVMPDKIPEFLEQELIKIQHNLDTCQRNISDSLILFKKATIIEDDPCIKNKIEIQNEEEVKSCSKKSNKVEVGYSDFDPKIEDEIYEIYLNNENSVIKLPNINFWDLEEKFEKKQKKELCKDIMNELKIRLKEKARHWKKRERELLKKKGVNNKNEHEEETESSNDEKEIKHNKENINVQKFCVGQKVFESFESNNTTKFKNLNKEGCPVETLLQPLECQAKYQMSQEHHSDINFGCGVNGEKNKLYLPNEDCRLSSTCENSQNFNKNFLNDLNLARKKILKSCVAVEEELFYASDEDSSSEDNHSL